MNETVEALVEIYVNSVTGCNANAYLRQLENTMDAHGFTKFDMEKITSEAIARRREVLLNHPILRKIVNNYLYTPSEKMSEEFRTGVKVTLELFGIDRISDYLNRLADQRARIVLKYNLGSSKSRKFRR